MWFIISALTAIFSITALADDCQGHQTIPQCFGSNYSGKITSSYKLGDFQTSYECQAYAGFKLQDNFLSLAPVWADCSNARVRDLDLLFFKNQDNSLYLVKDDGEVDEKLGALGKLEDQTLTLSQKVEFKRYLKFSIGSLGARCFPEGLEYSLMREFSLKLSKVDRELDFERRLNSMVIHVPGTTVPRELNTCQKLRDFYAADKVVKTESLYLSGKLKQDF